MIAFAVLTVDERRFRAGAMRAIAEVADRSSLLLRRHLDPPAPCERAQSCDELLDAAGRHGDLEALVLVGEATSRIAAGATARLRSLLAARPEVAAVAAPPGRDVRDGGLPGGALLALSPWAVRELRCDPRTAASPALLAGDLCLQARAGGRLVLVDAGLVADRLPVAPLAPAERRALLAARVALGRRWGEGVLAATP